ncbi:MAG: DUF1501 domain-containing protein, partial [Planctomycetota bacterium]
MNSSYYPCGKVSAPLQSRREWLRRAGCGFGAVAASALLSKWAKAESPPALRADQTNPLAPKPTHFAPKVKRVVYLYMDGGPSQVDT